MLNYPLKFKPIIKEKIWGGTELITKFNKKSVSKNIGESWEISDVKNNISVVLNGNLKGKSLKTVLKTYKSQLIGVNNYAQFGNNFPLLIKFIDAKQSLSVQVHPNNKLSKKRHNSFGKTEMWYIMQADKEALLVLGLNKKITKKQYTNLVENKKITSVLNHVKIKKGDSFFIETGTIHAIGAGVVLAEIQQTSDITYRIYDWDRVDNNGNSRELHTNMAVDAIDFSIEKKYKQSYKKQINTLNNIVKNKFFTTNFIPVKGKIVLNYSKIDSFVIFMCVAGSAIITVEENSEVILIGETILIPALVNEVTIISKRCKLLEITIC